MSIRVKSEIKPLKKVLLHRPGSELEHLTPGTLEQLLFDDIPYLKVAQQEHDAFAKALSENGVQVVYLEDLMAETLAYKPELKEEFIDDFISQSGSIAHNYRDELINLFLEISDEKKLVLKTMAGVGFHELRHNRKSSLVNLVRRDFCFILDPIPNLYFTRDPFASIGCGVNLNRMFSVTRNRETIYGRYILRYHQEYSGKVRFYYTPDSPFSIEGGDILNLSSSVLLVGISQRTTPEAIELLAKNIFRDENSEINTILAFDIPNMRAFMHLDTVFTQVDYDKFLVHPGIIESLRIYRICRGNGPDVLNISEIQDNLVDVLQKYLGLDTVTLIKCGGQDRIASEREQWNDGSNTLCIAPGVVVVYDRNCITNKILGDHGIRAIEIPGSELSRGRGGPRCMSMPLVRGD